MESALLRGEKGKTASDIDALNKSTFNRYRSEMFRKVCRSGDLSPRNFSRLGAEALRRAGQSQGAVFVSFVPDSKAARGTLYTDLFRLLRDSNAKSWFQSYPKSLPTLLMSGTNDPVGGYGKGVGYVYKHLLLAGAGNVRLKMYEGARHELFKETNRQEVFSDIAAFVEEIAR